MRLTTPVVAVCVLLAGARVWTQAPRNYMATQAPLQQGTVFVVRHAERADASADTGLSDAGRQRAVSLATLLKQAGITAIFVTEFKRTQETATPLANALGISPTVISAKEQGSLAVKLRRTTGNVLVVGHSNTVGDVLTSLGVTAPPIAETDYDNLFIVIPGPPSAGGAGASTRLIRLHYR